MPASAHVTIDTLGPVEQGSFAKLGFSVPNERDDAGTVTIRAQMPQDHPIAFVSVQPKSVGKSRRRGARWTSRSRPRAG
jgi:uncharacterized protein YcnI